MSVPVVWTSFPGLEMAGGATTRQYPVRLALELRLRIIPIQSLRGGEDLEGPVALTVFTLTAG
jgi:hypothetical protein